MNQLTVDQALKLGYSFYCEEGSEDVFPLKKARNFTSDEIEGYRERNFFLVEPAPLKYSLSTDSLKQAILKHIASSEDYDISDGIAEQVIGAIPEHYFETFSARLNRSFNKLEFWIASEIQLKF